MFTCVCIRVSSCVFARVYVYNRFIREFLVIYIYEQSFEDSRFLASEFIVIVQNTSGRSARSFVKLSREKSLVPSIEIWLHSGTYFHLHNNYSAQTIITNSRYFTFFSLLNISLSISCREHQSHRLQLKFI